MGAEVVWSYQKERWEVQVIDEDGQRTATIALTKEEAVGIADRIHCLTGVPSRNCPHCGRAI